MRNHERLQISILAYKIEQGIYIGIGVFRNKNITKKKETWCDNPKAILTQKPWKTALILVATLAREEQHIIMLRVSLLVALLALVVLYNGQVEGVRSQWKQETRATSSTIITVRLALTQRNLDILEVLYTFSPSLSSFSSSPLGYPFGYLRHYFSQLWYLLQFILWWVL